MANYQLVMLEASDIQEYVFGSNELVQNIGASELVFHALTSWVFETLDELGLTHNVPKLNGAYEIAPDLGQYEITDASIAENDLGAEVIYTGGGKALVMFRDQPNARAFVEKLTRRALRDAPGLALVVASESVTWDTENDLRRALAELNRKLNARKHDRPFSTPLLGLGVTAPCAFTGLPAVNDDWYAEQNNEPMRLVSVVVDAKIRAFRDYQDERLQMILPQVRTTLQGKHALQDFVYDFDLLGSHGASSYLAVVHTDGNGMGKRFKKLGEKFSNNQDHARALRRLSASVSRASTAALNEAINALLQSHDDETDTFGGIVPVPLKAKRERNPQTGKMEIKRERQLPFRPIVFGGDDVTFVCEGRLGLTMAREYLNAYAAQELDDGKPATARGGAAVVHTHFPFARAYALSAKLCDSAKKYIKKFPNESLTALDWHFAVSGAVRDLDEIRAREYKVGQGNLYLRPYRLTVEDKDKLHTWGTFEKLARYFSTRTDDAKNNWSESRNKRRALRDALRAGPGATEQFLTLNGFELLKLEEEGFGTIHETGWQGELCGYYDALEALDFYVELKKEQQT